MNIEQTAREICELAHKRNLNTTAETMLPQWMVEAILHGKPDMTEGEVAESRQVHQQSLTPRAFDSVAELVATMDAKVIVTYINRIESELAEAKLPTVEHVQDIYKINKLQSRLTQLEQAGEGLAKRLEISDNHLLNKVGVTSAHYENNEAITTWNTLTKGQE